MYFKKILWLKNSTITVLVFLFLWYWFSPFFLSFYSAGGGRPPLSGARGGRAPGRPPPSCAYRLARKIKTRSLWRHKVEPLISRKFDLSRLILNHKQTSREKIFLFSFNPLIRLNWTVSFILYLFLFYNSELISFLFWTLSLLSNPQLFSYLFWTFS